jgi:hypothetical protein
MGGAGCLQNSLENPLLEVLTYDPGGCTCIGGTTLSSIGVVCSRPEKWGKPWGRFIGVVDLQSLLVSWLQFVPL